LKRLTNMKTIQIVVCFSLMSVFLLFSSRLRAADTLKVESKVGKVVVFLKGAQIKRSVKCKLDKGVYLINFTKLSSHVVDKSVQVTSDSSVGIQSVSFQVNYMDSLTRIQKITGLEALGDSLENEKLMLSNSLDVLKNEEELLQINQVLGGEKKTMKTEDLEKAVAYYHERISEIVELKNKTQNRLKHIDAEKQSINNQLKELNSKKEKPVGEVWVVARVEEKGEKQFVIEYFIPDAGWTPKYDMRADSLSKPALLAYKADVYQNTDDDWTNVQMILSSSNPSLEGTKPVLKSWTLDVDKDYSYNSLDLNRSRKETSNYDNSVLYYQNIKNDYSAPIQIDNGTRISGTVVDNNGQALPGVSIMVPGTSIGAITDLEGKYSILVTKGTEKITFSFVGFETEALPITGTTVNCVLAEAVKEIEEVVVIGYGTSKRNDLTGSVSTLVNDGFGNFVPEGSVINRMDYSGSSRRKNKKDLHLWTSKKLIGKTITGLNSIKENQTSIEFVLDKPYTIPSDNKNYSVDIEKYEVPVHFQYSTVPKMETSAFLIAQLEKWEELNLLSGTVNIYFEGSFIGSSELDVQKTKDTLDISMGRDKAIIIDRVLKENFDKNHGKNSSYTWEINVRNTKSDSIQLMVEDQIPLTYSKDFEIELLESTNALYDKEKGELKWMLNLAPMDKKTISFKYLVKSKN
jgi:hypothetical protein